jgi:membrane protease YdiL (CAAX protease family)
VLGPAAIIAASVALALVVGAEPPSWEMLTDWRAMVLFPIALVDGPLPEESSFRGYGQHQLQRTMSPLAASLWIGLGVLIWHLPVLVAQYIPWPIAIALPAVSVVYAWLYRQGGSIWPLVALHMTQNVIGGMYFGRMFSPRDSVFWTGFLAVFYVAWAAALAWHFGPTLCRDSRSS